jgi:CelD/BcsL family acetyltransferase involved in cellulose biosynthesis
LHEWTELEREALEPNPFFAQQLVLPAARHLGGGSSVRLLVAESGGRLLFLLPVVPARAGFGGVALPQLRSWVHDYCFLGTPLVSGQEDPDRIWTAVRSGLRRVGRAHLLIMRLHAGDGPVSAALGRADAQGGFGVRQASVTVRGFVHRRPAQTYATEWMAKKHLANLARRRRQLSQRLEASIDTTDRAAVGLDQAIEEFLGLEANGWKGRTGTALLCRPGHDRFFREVCLGFAEEGRLMFLGLQAGVQVLAFSTALLAGPGLFGFKKAYDETFARWSPGTLLDLEVLAWFHAMGNLDWLDTCSAPDEPAGGQLFGDRRPIRTLLLPVSVAGRAAAAMISTSRRAHGYLREISAGGP